MFFAVYLIFLLLPLSVDNVSLPILHYHVRLNYFGAAVLAALSIYAQKEKFIIFFKKRGFLFFAFMGLSGLVGIYVSTNFERSLFFWLWAMGTVFLVPWLADSIRVRLGIKASLALVGYAFLQALLVITDACLCIPTHGRLHIGRAQVFTDYNPPICRPQAFYQEPGYFCAFALLILPLLWLLETKSEKPRWFLYAQVLICVAIIFTTSRMGWLGVGVFAFLRLLEKPSRKIMTGFGFFAVFIGLIFATNWKSFHAWVSSAFHAPAQDKSFQQRYQRSAKAFLVFQDTPWVGAGPGSAGAWYVDHHREDAEVFLKNIKATDPTVIGYLRNDPLAQNLYLELLGDWGLLGTLAFFGGLVVLLWPLPRKICFSILALLAIVYLSTQTLARFDLWFVIGMLIAEDAHQSQSFKT